MFPNQNDIIASTFIFNGHDGSNISAGANQIVSVALIPAFFAVNLADSAEPSYYYETKLYQIAFGHRFYFMNNVFMLHPFIGVGLARVRETQQTGYLGLDGTPQDSAVAYMVSQFNGLGPLVGLDLAWHIWSYFNFNGTIAFPDDMNANLMAVTNGDVAFKGPFIRFSVSI